jgi:hypothetical protein
MEPLVLEAQARSGIPMPRGVRDLHTTITNPHFFDVDYPGTNISCKEVLTVYFHTNIHLKKDTTELVTFDSRTWKVFGKDAVAQTVSAIMTIGGMKDGSQEMRYFRETVVNDE